jgi:glycine betaine catabolism B
MNVTFDHAEAVAEGIKTFWFKPEKPVRYTAGQFTELYLPHTADDRGIRRWFTISSSPTEPLIGITTKSAGEAGSTYKKLLFGMQPGTPLQLADPMGDFVLPKDMSIPLVFIAIGMGVTPVRSMVKYLCDTGEKRNIQIMYAATHDNQLAFLPLFKASGFPLTTIVKKPSPAYHGETGTITTECILRIAPDNGQKYYYLSGPEIVVEVITKELIATGIAPERVITDYFPGYPQL